jgi:hypothetical protein
VRRSAPDVLLNDLVRALASIVLRRFHRQTHLLDQIPAEADEASNAVILPAGGFADLGEGGALLAPQHFPGRWLSLCPRDPQSCRPLVLAMPMTRVDQVAVTDGQTSPNTVPISVHDFQVVAR